MAATIAQTVNDTEKTVEDKVRALPANQGKNDNALWLLIDTEVAQSITDGKGCKDTNRTGKHGNK